VSTTGSIFRDMSRRVVFAVAGVILIACSAPATPPNVLLYVVDTLRADALEAYGNAGISTPAFSRLAREGTLFGAAYAASTWTRPSVASLLTGLDPDVHGVETRRDHAPESLRLLSESFRERGYATACITTNPNIASFFGFDQGYDEFEELYARRRAGRVHALEDHAASDEVTRRAIAWIDSAPRPFFLFVLSADPHWPYEPPARFDRYGGSYTGRVNGRHDARRRLDLDEADRQRIRSLYHAEVTFTDDSLGRLLDHLDERDLANSTVVVVTSDHGEEFWEHGQNGHGKELFEETLRVPLLVRYPAGVEAGAVVATPVRAVDLAPTLFTLTGSAVPEGIDGVSLFETRPGGAVQEVYASLQLDRARHKAWVEHPWKLVWSPGLRKARLFHLERDPGERHDLAAEQPQRVAEMKARLHQRATRNAARRGESGRAAREAAGPVPDEVRGALEALGYLDPAAEPERAPEE